MTDDNNNKMPKIIIYIPGKPGLHGHKRREFHWSPPHGVYLYRGKELELEQFNEAWVDAYRRHHDMNPQVKVVADGAAPAPRPKNPPIAEMMTEEVKPASERPRAPRIPKQPKVAMAMEVA